MKREGWTNSRRKSRRIPLFRTLHLIAQETRGNIWRQNESYGRTPLSIWKNGDELPFYLPSFPVVARRRSTDDKVTSPMTTLHPDVLAESRTQNGRLESYPHLGRLHRPIISSENKSANLFWLLLLPWPSAS